MYAENSYITSMETFYYHFLNHYQGSYTKRILDEAVALLYNLWPYLVAGIILTTVVKIFISKAWITSFFSKNKKISILIGAIIGVIAPLGSYVVIPLSAALFGLGVPLPALMALLVASPLIDPTLFLLTAGAFGIKFALVRLVSAFLLGVTAGYCILLLDKFRLIDRKKDIAGEKKGNTLIPVNPVTEVHFRQFGKELYRMTLFISKYFFLAVLLAALIKILTPPELITRLFGGNSFMSVAAATGAGIPFYVCGGAAIPVVQQMADLGMSQGAALAFFISGPVTKISNLLLMHAAFSFRIFLLYLTIGITGAFFFGLLYNLLF
jgi:uncharacterized membrane protein YraQ (UPF0718 family)